MSKPPGRTVPVAVLLSGGGRTLANFLRRIEGGDLPIRVVAVVPSRADAGGLEIARAAGLPAAVFRRRDYPDAGAHSAAINAWLASFAPRMILLAGWLCYYVPPAGFPGPVLNIHPALLPKHGGRGMYGDRVHAAVLAAGETESGERVMALLPGGGFRRGALTELAYHIGRFNSAIASAQPAQLVPLVVAVADRLARFSGRPAYRTLRAEDKRAVIDFRRSLLTL